MSEIELSKIKSDNKKLMIFKLVDQVMSEVKEKFDEILDNARQEDANTSVNPESGDQLPRDDPQNHDDEDLSDHNESEYDDDTQGQADQTDNIYSFDKDMALEDGETLKPHVDMAPIRKGRV